MPRAGRYLPPLYHMSFTAPFILSMFLVQWNRLFFWYFLHTIILNITGLSWAAISLFKVHHRPNYNEYRRMSEESMFRGGLTLLNLLFFSKFALWYSGADKSSFLYTYHWIQGFVVLTLMVFTTFRILYILVRYPLYAPPTRQACIKAVFALITGYILFIGMLGTGVKEFKIDSPKTSHTFASFSEASITCKIIPTQNIPNCKGVDENWTFFNRFLLLGAFLWVILSLDNASPSSPIFNLNVRVSRAQKTFYLAVSVYGCFFLQYAIFHYGAFFLTIYQGRVFNCSSSPTISYMYAFSVAWFLVLGQCEALVLLPGVLKRNLKDVAHDLKHVFSIMSIRVQYLVIKFQEKLGSEIDEKQRQKLQKLELQARIRPLTGFDHKLAPHYLVKEEDCSICLEQLCNSQFKLVYWRTCLHFYHENCLKLWTRNHTQCPMCMQQM